MKQITQPIVQIMKDTEILVLSKTQSFWHYSIVIFFFIIPAIITIAILKYFLAHTYNGVRSIGQVFLTGYIWILPAIIFYFIQRRRLRLKIINFSVDKTIFEKAIELTSKELEWEIEEMANNCVIAKSRFSCVGHRFMLVDIPGNPILSMYGDDIIYYADNLSKLLVNEIFSGNIYNVFDFESPPQSQPEIKF